MFNNLSVKLVCLVVAIVLWVQVAGNLDVEEIVELPVEVVGLPDSLVVRTAALPSDVTVRIRGSKLQLLTQDALRRDRGRVELDLTGARPGTRRYEITVLDVRVSAVPVEVVPARQLEFRVHRVAQREVPVRLAVEGQLPAEFTLGGRPEISPGEVEVRGPRVLVSALDHVNTRPLRLDRRRGSFQETLELASPDVDVLLHPREVEVAVWVDKIVERAFVNVPISIFSDLDAAQVHVEPTSAQVRVTGAAGIVEALGPEEVSVVLHIGALEPGVYELPAEVVAPDGIGSTSIDPLAFQVIVEDGDTGPQTAPDDAPDDAPGDAGGGAREAGSDDAANPPEPVGSRGAGAAGTTDDPGGDGNGNGNGLRG